MMNQKQQLDAFGLDNGNPASLLTKRPVLSELVYDYMLDSIANGTLRTGEKINAEGLSRKLNVSRTPIREALRALEQNGLVVSVPFSGVYVSKLTIDEIQELYNIRLLLEPYALQHSIEKIKDDDIQQLAALQEQIESIIDNPSSTPRLIFKHNQDFHMQLFSYSQMPKLCGIIEQLWYNLSFYRLLLAGQSNYPAQLKAEHHAYLNALKQRNSDELCSICHNNLTKHVNQMPAIVTKYYESIKD